MVPRFTIPEGKRLAELRTALGTLCVARPEALPSLMSELRTLLRADAVLSYGVAVTSEAFGVERLSSQGLSWGNSVARAALDAGMRGTRERWGLYNPARPQPAQRNAAVALPEARLLYDCLVQSGRLHCRLGLRAADLRFVEASVAVVQKTHTDVGLLDVKCLRVLLCDGPSLLAWVGGYRDAPFGDRERRLLNALVPDLRRRLILERALDTASFAGSALPVALEAVGAPAYLITATARVVQANTAGLARLREQPAALAERLRGALRGLPTGITVTAIAKPGLLKHWLAVEQLACCTSDGSARLALAATRFGLTPRQTQTLARLAEGDSNKTIAAHLACAERTVEVHVGQLLAKLGVESRAALVARFWTLRQ